MGDGVSPRATFICTDTQGNGAEVCAAVEAPVSDIIALAVAASGGEANLQWAEEELQAGEPSFSAKHVHTGLVVPVGWAASVPDELFFPIERAEQSEVTMVVSIGIQGLRFRERNEQLETRVRCVAALLDDLNEAFGEPDYQEKLNLAKDRTQVQNLIRSVHLRVLPGYGFRCLGVNEERITELVLQMQGFIQSAVLTKEVQEASWLTLTRSGYFKMKTLPTSLKAWSDRHKAAAADFRDLLLRMRHEGSLRFQDEMVGLWRAAVLAQGSPESPFSKIANKTLLRPGGMADTLCRDAAGVMEEDGVQAAALEDLVDALSAFLDKPVLQPFAQSLLGLQPGEVDIWPFGAHGCKLLVLLLIWLPLAFYVRNTMHLYEMLERLQLRAPHMEGAFQVDAAADGAEALRAMLNRDERHYAYLAYAVMAALQTMRFACEDLGWRDPLALLGSSPPGNCTNGYPMSPPSDWPESQLIFRGIWVGPEIDEERARFQYSFQSFSRDLVGMATVLSFYAGIGGSPAQRIAHEHRRVLVFVARALWFTEGCLALPVQLFDGPQAFDSEREVLLPPYVQYRFEDDLSLSSEDFPYGVPSERALNVLEKWRRRWPGFELPELLLRMLRRESPPEFAGMLYQHMNPFITVRFIHKVRLPPPLEPLLKDRSLQLYNFERVV